MTPRFDPSADLTTLPVIEASIPRSTSRRLRHLRTNPLGVLSATALLFVLAGCAADSGLSAEDEPSGAEERAPSGETAPANDGGVDQNAPAPVVPCDETKSAAIKAALDASHDVTKSDAVLSIKTPSCGIRFYSSGPSKVKESTLHRIASNTKTYVASLILELSGDGLLALTDPVSKWFSGVPGGDAIRIENLLWHTSGLAPYEESLLFQAAAAADKKWKPTELIGFSLKARTHFAAGTSWEYVNVNYTMLGVIAESVTSKPLATLLRERIFQKIGVNSTFSDGAEPLVGELAIGRDKLGADSTHAIDSSTFWAAGHLVSTPGDLVVWTEKRHSGQFHAAPLNEAFEKVIDWKPERAGWKYGPGTIQLEASVTSGGGIGRGHGGDYPGYHSMAFYFADKQSTVVMIHDHDYLTGEEMRRPFFSALKALFGGT